MISPIFFLLSSMIVWSAALVLGICNLALVAWSLPAMMHCLQ